MVLSLTDYCLMAVRNSVEKGIIQSIHQLPPTLRQRVLEIILMHGTINRPMCLKALSSPEFLFGLTSFDVQIGNVDDSNYLRLIAASMAKILPDGTTIGSQFLELKLNIYERRQRPGNVHQDDSTNLRTAITLIAQCPNLVSLDLRVVDDYVMTHPRGISRPIDHDDDQEENRVALPSLFSDDLWMAGLLNEFQALAPCLDILKRITSFKLRMSGMLWELPEMTNEDYPMLQFNRLTSLNLNKVKIEPAAWLEFLSGCRQTLESFSMVQADSLIEWKTDFILPYPLPNLKSLKLTDLRDCTRLLVKNLNECPKLERASLEFDVRAGDDLRWSSLIPTIENNPAVNVTIDASTVMRHNTRGDADKFDSDSNFKVVNLFSKHIRSLDVEIWQDYWDERAASALTQALKACQNLEVLAVVLVDDNTGALLEAPSAALIEFFQDQRRAFQLRELDLSGNFDPAVYDAIFNNCLNLERLDIALTNHINDLHLINWVQCGARPLRHFYFSRCKNITDEGLIPIIVNSHKYLEHVELDKIGRVTKRTWFALANNCPYLNCVFGIPKRWIRQVKSKMFLESVRINV